MKIIKFKSKYYKQVNNIYKSSFPIEERYISLNKMIRNKETVLYCLIEKEMVLGIIYLIFYKDMIFILYLAVSNEIRSKGYGSYLLEWCVTKYKDRKIYLNIEEVNENEDNYIIRKRRLDFYIKNNFFITNYISKEDKENFNILSNCEEINIDEYKKLDKFVADILEEPVSDIMERDNRIS